MEVDTAKWNLCGCAKPNQSVWWNPYRSGTSHLWDCLVRGTGACPLRRWRWTLQTKILPRHTADMQFSFNLYPCWTTHHLMKIYATLPYIVITLKFKILFLWNLKILQVQNLIVSLKGLYFIKNWVLKRSLFFIFLSLYCIGNNAQLLCNVCTEPVLVWCRGFL